mmetsp:Transcript_59407/g.133409  ORF Transcript_59407/g.133409 Transcript_59407/m.133409 type:complete len:464 (+) Transcript_59407:70-1461(+)
MPRPASTLFQARLPCGPALDDLAALRACEKAAVECGYRVASRSGRALVLLPGPPSSLFRCFTPQAAHLPSTASGNGIMTELVPKDDGDGFEVTVASSAQNVVGQSFVEKLNRHMALPDTMDLSSPPEDEMERQRSEVSLFKKEASAYYYFSRLLLNQEHPCGAAAAEFVTVFNQQHGVGSHMHSKDGKAMQECIAAVARIAALVKEHVDKRPAQEGGLAHRLTNAELHTWLQSSVERSIFSRISGNLWRLYEGCHAADDAEYSRKSRMLATLSDATLMEMLEIRPAFRGAIAHVSKPTGLVSSAGDHAPEGSTALPTPSTVAESADEPTTEWAPVEEHFGYSPYERAAAALSQIEASLQAHRGVTPREATEGLVLSQLEMKTCALEASEGKVELAAMDDIMPLFIFVALRSSLTRPFACSRFMRDALGEEERMDSEGRCVLLLESAARHVAFDWDISSVSPPS